MARSMSIQHGGILLGPAFLLFGLELALPLVDQAEGVERGEAVEFQLADVVQQVVVGGGEQRELEVALAGRGLGAGDLGPAFGVEMFFFELGEDFLRPFDDLARHAGQPGHVDAVALGTMGAMGAGLISIAVCHEFG